MLEDRNGAPAETGEVLHGDVVGRPAPRSHRRARGAGVGILASVGRDVSAVPVDNAERLLDAAGLRWEIERREVFTKAPSGELVRDERAVALTRGDTGDVFGYASPGYQPAQNAIVAQMFAGALAGLGLRWQRAGSINGGRTIFVLAKVVDVPVVKGDESEMFLLLQNGHDTTGALRAGVTFNRLFCANQFPALERDGNAMRFRHNGTGISDLAGIIDRIGKSIEAGKEDAEAFRLLASRQCKRIDPLLDAVFPIPRLEDGKTDTGRANAGRLRARDKIAELFDGEGKGLKHPGVAGTLWAAYQAVVEYEDHFAPRRSDESGLFGASAQRKTLALKSALKLA